MQAPPNLSDDLRPAARLRHRRLGRGVARHRRPRQPRAGLAGLDRAAPGHRGRRADPGAAAHHLPRVRPRPRALARSRMRFRVLDHSDAEALGREDRWCSGGVELATAARWTPVSGASRPAPCADGSSAARRAGVGGWRRGRGARRRGTRPGGGRRRDRDAVLGARWPEVRAVAEVADQLRRDEVGDVVTWVANRNINYTNVCTFKCRFCAFSKGPLSLNLRGVALPARAERHHRTRRRGRGRSAPPRCVSKAASTPSSTGTTTSTSSTPCAAASPTIHIHGFTALEVTEGARRLEEPLVDYLRRLQRCGARHAAGHGGGDPRRRGARRAVPRQDQHRAVARGASRRPQHRAAVERHDHVRLDRTAPVLGAAPRAHPRPADARPVVSPSSSPSPSCTWPLPSTCSARPGGARRSGRRVLMHAVGRIAYHGWIPNIQVSWVKMGAAGAAQALRPGRTTWAGRSWTRTSPRAAGASHGQLMGEEEFRALVEPLGRTARASAPPCTVAFPPRADADDGVGPRQPQRRRPRCRRLGPRPPAGGRHRRGSDVTPAAKRL